MSGKVRVLFLRLSKLVDSTIHVLAAQNNPNGEWTPNGPNGSPFPGPPQQAQFPPPPEGYYPAFYAIAPPPPGPGPQLVPVNQSGSPTDQPVEGQSEGAVDLNANGQNGDNPQQPQGPPAFPPPHGQFVYPPLAHGSYPPPYGYPFPGPPQQQQPPQQPQPPDETPANSKKRVSAEGEVKEDEDEEDPPTPPRKKRGRRNSDGEWPGATKRVAKAKVESATATRRSTRRQHHPQDAENVGSGDGHDEGNAGHTDTVTETIAPIIEQDASNEDPVIQSETA